jgi:hypothetical protein
MAVPIVRRDGTRTNVARRNALYARRESTATSGSTTARYALADTTTATRHPANYFTPTLKVAKNARVATIRMRIEQGATLVVRVSIFPAALPARIVREGTIRLCLLQAAAFLAVQGSIRACLSKRVSAMPAPLATFHGRSR